MSDDTFRVLILGTLAIYLCFISYMAGRRSARAKERKSLDRLSAHLGMPPHGR